MKLNGFEIETYNQYGFKEGDKTSTCPKCSEFRKKKTDKCVKIDWETGFADCYHCGEAMQLHTYKKTKKEKEYVLPEFKYHALDENVIKYFEDRGISQKTLARVKVTQQKEWMPQTKKEENVICFNYFLDDQLINVKYRDARKNFKLYKDAEKIFYNLDSIRTAKECVIVEGEIDALSFIEAGYFNVVSVPNGFNLKGNINLDYLDNYTEYFENKEKIYLCLDNDEAGQKGKEEFIRRLGGDKCYICDLSDLKDANEYLCQRGRESLLEVIRDSKLTPLENVLVLEDLEKDLDQFWLNGIDKGKTIDLNPFDDAYSLEYKQYTLITGVPQSGKSEFLDYMLVKYNLKYGDKIAYCSVENEPFIFHYDKIFQKIYGNKPKEQKELDVKYVKDVKKHISNNFYHVKFDKRYYLEDVLSKFAELVKRKGVRLFVLDPYNKIRLKSGNTDVNRYTEEYHLLIDEFVKKYDAHVFLVAHPVKMTLQEGSEKTYLMPSAYNLKGGGEHFDMSYNIIGVNRLYELKMVHVKTLKVKFRHLGENQKDCYFSFNTVNGRYEELAWQPNDTITEEIPAKDLDYSNWMLKEFGEDENNYLSLNDYKEIDF